MRYFLYAKFPNQKRFRPVNWRQGKQVINLIHASIFEDSELPELRKSLELPENKGVEFKLVRAGK